MWVDFRLQSPEPLGQLIWGITGNKPGTTPIIQPDKLDSEKGIDYTRLRDLLAAKNWKEADKETYRVMIQAVGKEDGDYFNKDELLNFPCTDLRTIDHLWIKYSNGHFGFSVQKEIYLSVGGKADGKYNVGAGKKFGDRVGWRVKSNLIWIEDIIFETASPKGHLPFEWGFWGFIGESEISSLASRLVKCNIFAKRTIFSRTFFQRPPQ
jgi:hypothetical protein